MIKPSVPLIFTLLPLSLFLSCSKSDPIEQPEMYNPFTECVTFEECKLECPEGADLVPAEGRGVYCIALNKLHGPRVEFNSEGIRLSGQEFWYNTPHGIEIVWFENGQFEYAVYHIEGQKLGDYLAWYPDGTLRNQGQYGDGKRCGVWKCWDEEGKPTECSHLRTCELTSTGAECAECPERKKAP